MRFVPRADGMADFMKLLLTKNVARLGLVGEVVDVTGGYARNFLIPRGVGVQPTAANMKRIEADKVKMQELEAARLSSLRALAERLNGADITVVEKANASGELYGSVTARKIAEELQKEGFPVPEEAVKLAEPLKQVNVYEVAVELAHEIGATVKVYVAPEKTADA